MLKKDDCQKLNNEFVFFQNILMDILIRRAIFKKFEDEMKKTHLTEHNDMMALVWYGYTISQLSDCRKFFARDDDAHSFQFVVCHIKNEVLKKEHKTLFIFWKEEDLETVLNKYLLHANMRFRDIKTEVHVRVLDLFIDKLEKYIESIKDDLLKNYSGISVVGYGNFLLEREREVDVFFKEVRKNQ